MDQNFAGAFSFAATNRRFLWNHPNPYTCLSAVVLRKSDRLEFLDAPEMPKQTVFAREESLDVQ
jgi:hypothetical protein